MTNAEGPMASTLATRVVSSRARCASANALTKSSMVVAHAVLGTPAAAGAGAYFNRKLVGTGAYFQKNRVAGVDALVPLPRMRGVNGVGAGMRMSSAPTDLFSAY